LTPASGQLRIGAIVLAAGAATRMGRLKQLLPYRGRTLIGHSIHQALDARLKPLIVVVGAAADALSAALANEPVEIARNACWESGMGSSIVAGMRCLDGRKLDAVAILLADQPLVSSDHLMRLAALLQPAHIQIAAAEYNGALGVPAFFKRDLFPSLAALPPEAGARNLLRGARDGIARYPLPEAAADIDTPEDFKSLEDSETQGG
jgi:molybdenum cofactor cytidylyltransferase